MRLSDWRAAAKPRESLGPKVTDVLQAVLSTLGAEDDPHTPGSPGATIQHRGRGPRAVPARR
jgi:hypothetical protein